MQKSNFLKTIMVLRAFFRIEAQMISNPSTRLEKKHQTPEFLLMNDFYDFLKLIFRISNIFKNNQLHILKSLYVSMLDQTQYSLISQFLTFILSRMVSTFSFNVKL